jgi:RNA polymerase sigma-70 factor (ECF subfamily)
MSDASTTRRWFAATPPDWSLTVTRPAEDHPGPRADHLAAESDPALVARARGGDPDAFDVLVTRHRRAVYQVCFRFVHQHEDASDLAQEVFVRAWRGLARFKGDAAFSTWLYRIAVNACLNKVSTRGLAAEPLGDRDHFEDPHAERPGAGLRREERATAVRRAIGALPARQRATLVLRVYHELTHQQIADILGSSVGAVKANFFHALANLKKILGSEP